MNLFDKLLTYYHINKDDYARLTKEVNEGDVPNFKVFKNIELVRDKTLDAINKHMRILIYGDYDADGIMATTIMFKALSALNADVNYYIPSRYLDGYGLTAEKVIKAKENGFSLIITVDNGIKAIEAIKKAKELNLDLIITDHHSYDSLPDVPYLLHPDLSSLKVTTSGAMVAFYLSYALLNKIDPYLLVLGGTSIISDVMPLLEENRTIVRLALKELNRHKYDQFNLLSGTYEYSEETLASHVIPKINAVGRIEQDKEVNVLVKYFASQQYKEIINIRDYINQVNEKRKDLATLALNTGHVDLLSHSIVLKLDCLSGLSGLIANRFLMQYHKPTCIFCRDRNPDYLRASLRSKNGCNVMDFVKENEKMLVEFGGHAFAAGLTIKQNDYETFKERFENFARMHPFVGEENQIPIISDDLTLANFTLIRSFAPFGEGWREPTFILKNVDTSLFQRMGKNNEHLAINFAPDIKVIGFNYPFDETACKSAVDLTGHYRLNKYKNRISLNFVLEN